MKEEEVTKIGGDNLSIFCVDNISYYEHTDEIQSNTTSFLNNMERQNGIDSVKAVQLNKLDGLGSIWYQMAYIYILQNKAMKRYLSGIFEVVMI